MTTRKNLLSRNNLSQLVLLAGVILLGLWLYGNLQSNLATLGQEIGFSSLQAPAGFPISEAVPLPFPGVIEGILGLVFLAGLCLPKNGPLSLGMPRLPRAFVVLLGGWLLLRLGTGQWSTLTLEAYTPESSYVRALATGLLNTVKVGVAGLLFASLLGFSLGVARLSTLPEIAGAAAAIVHTARSIPVLLQLIFWYVVILNFSPLVAESLTLFERTTPEGEAPLHSIYLNNRGLFLPQPQFGGQADLWAFLILCVVVTATGLLLLKRACLPKANRKPRLAASLCTGLGLLGLVIGFAWGGPQWPEWSFPRLTFGGRNIAADLILTPEYLALLLGLGIYTASYIAEIVRGGILSVDPGQREAARALGLSAWQSLRLVIMPQAWRVIVPPLTSQYLNLVKNSSLAVAVGYPDLVGVGGTILNQSGRSLEVILVWMAIYLFISLSISGGLALMQARQRHLEGQT